MEDRNKLMPGVKWVVQQLLKDDKPIGLLHTLNLIVDGWNKLRKTCGN